MTAHHGATFNAQEIRTMSSTDFIGRPHDFDFLVGRWKVAQPAVRRQ